VEYWVNKEGFLDIIRLKHRQLERYLFVFEKNGAGVFVASVQTKFGENEMVSSLIFKDWTLKDLLCQVIAWERRFIIWYQSGLQGDSIADLPPSDLDLSLRESEDYPLPMDLHALSIRQVLNEFHQSYGRVVALIESIPEAALFTSGRYAWTGQHTLADFAALCTFRQYDWAKVLIRKWRKAHAGKYLDKEILLERIRTERRRLELNLEGLSAEQMVVTGVVGSWSVKDILAHLVDWEQRFLGWYKVGKRGEHPEIPATGIGWENLDELNQQIYEKHRDRSLGEVLDDFHASFAQVLQAVELMEEDEIFSVGRYAWLGGGNLLGYILANTANHYRWAKQQIRSWLKSTGEIL
jgi:hypothetical protein